MKKVNTLVLSLISLFVISSCNDINSSSNENSSTPNDNSSTVEESSSNLSDSSTIKNTSISQESTNENNDSISNESSIVNYTYLDFTPTEKRLFTESFGYVIPFLANNEYYVEDFELQTKKGINFYTYNNSQNEFEEYLSELLSLGFTSDGSDIDKYGDTWYFYVKDDVYIDACYYLSEQSYVSDIYIYKIFENNDDSSSSNPSDSSDSSDNEVGFTLEEKSLFEKYFDFEVPFINSDSYYVKEYTFENEIGINYYTFGNGKSEFDEFLNNIESLGFKFDNTSVDEYEDTWYLYSNGNIYLDASYYLNEGDYVIDIYIYTLENEESGGNDSDDTGDLMPTSYNKVTSALTDYSGQYLIVYEGSNVALDGSLTSLDAKGNFKNVDIVNHSIAWTKELDNYSFTIEKYGNGYSILSSSGQYIGSNQSGSNTITSSLTPLENEISFKGNELNIISSAGTYLRYNTSDNRFRYYKSASYSSQAAICLYKLNVTSSGSGNEPIVPTDDVTEIDFNASNVTFSNKNDNNYYEYGCPTMNDGTTTPKVLVIPVQFSDVTAQSKGYTIQAIKNAFLPKSETNAKLDYYSVYDYFYASSYGKLSLDITVCENWFTPKDKSTDYANYYDDEGNFIGEQLIMDEALSYLSTIMDLSKFDSNGDFVIDSVVMINTLNINPDENFYWAYQYYNMYVDNQGYYYEYDGVSANAYLWAQYGFLYDDGTSKDYNGLANPTNTYTFIHEFSHVLDAEDYYDYSEYRNDPLKGYDIMDSVAADHNPFTKMHYGWIDSTRLITTSSSVTIDLNAFEKTGDTIIIANNYDVTKGVYQEYWLICYYNNTGLNESPYGLFDKEGIVVYHVNATLVSEYYNGKIYYYFANSNTDSSEEYGSVNNLIEFVSNGNEYVYEVGDKLSSTIKDDNNVKVPYTFTVDSIDETKATLTFNINK